MFKPLLTRLLNHLLNQNSWARQQLQPYGGKAVRFNMPPVSVTLTVLEDGGLAAAGDTAAPDASVTMLPSVALRLLANDETANTLVTLEGDTELAAALSKVLRGMRWEYEEDLSRVIGDAPAYEIAQFGRKAAAGVRKQTINLAEMLAEYWQEEQPMLAKKRHVARFVQDVDTLREDTERLQKRLEKLTATLTNNSPKDPPNS